MGNRSSSSVGNKNYGKHELKQQQQQRLQHKQARLQPPSRGERGSKHKQVKLKQKQQQQPLASLEYGRDLLSQDLEYLSQNSANRLAANHHPHNHHLTSAPSPSYYRDLHHQHTAHAAAAAEAEAAALYELSGSNHHLSQTSSYLPRPPRGARPRHHLESHRQRHNHNRHLHHEEPFHAQLYNHHHHQQQQRQQHQVLEEDLQQTHFAPNNGSSQTYRSTPLASSSSSTTQSTSAAAHLDLLPETATSGHNVYPYEYAAEDDDDDEYEDRNSQALYEDDENEVAYHHHLTQAAAAAAAASSSNLNLNLNLNHYQHLSGKHQLHIATPPARCLDSCCNLITGATNSRAATEAAAAAVASLASEASKRRPQIRPNQRGAVNTTNSKKQVASAGNSSKLATTTTTAKRMSSSNGINGGQQKSAGSAVAALERGLAHNEADRKRLGLLGLLPAVVQDQELQSRAVMNFIANCQDELGKYVYLRNLKDFNEKLFYFTLTRNVSKLMPLVYTPTVGLACQKFSEIYMRPRGLWVTLNDAGRVKQVLENWPERDVRVIVVTDGERILGLGDLGANGMGISIGKLSLYTALAGISPANVLPVTIDVGTNNEAFLKDPFYIGLRRERARGAAYDSLIEEFMREVVERWGRSCLIQFEDFANSTAFTLLKRYRGQYCTFNDDIQGTASVALAGLITAARETGKRLSDCNFLFYGAGEANLGTAQLMIMAMLDEGTTRAEAKKRIWLVDSKGLVVSSRGDLNEHKLELAQELSADQQQQQKQPLKSLEQIIDLVRPLAIIGASAQGGSFTRAICEKMAQYNERPIIFALSNPTSKAECTAAQAYEWTQGKCLFASGSPFEPVQFNGKTYVTGQGNNAYIFPGVGLAAIGAHTHIIPEDTFLVAARALSDQVTRADLDVGLVYPSLTKIREVTLKVATRVLEHFYSERLATYRPEPSDKRAFLEAIQYDPRY